MDRARIWFRTFFGSCSESPDLAVPMKTRIMSPVYRFLLLVFLCSCSVNDSDLTSDGSDNFQITGPGYRFIADAVRYNQLDFNRNDPSTCQISFEIKSIKRVDQELSLEILRPKGCNGIYDLVWDGKWQDSAPAQLQIYLTGSFNSCGSGTEKETDLVKVDLAKALPGRPGSSYSIYIREYCSFRDFNCVGNCELRI